MANTTCRLLRLPKEIQLQILSESRPDGFESLMLTCKQMFNAGSGSIQEHNFCKFWGPRNWPAAPGRRTHLKNYTATNNPLQFFERLLDEPLHLRWWLLLYITAVNIKPDYTISRQDVDMTVVRRISTEWPWLKMNILDIMQASPCLFKAFHSARKVSLHLNGHESQVLVGDELNDINGLYSTFILLLLPNLTKIYSEDSITTSPRTCMQMLPELVHQSLGHTHFQRLQTLHIKDDDRHNIRMDTVAPFTLLPGLRSLKVDGLNCYDGERAQAIRFDWPAGIMHAPPMEQLILLGSVSVPEELSNILQRLNSLSSLVLEFRASREFRTLTIALESIEEDHSEPGCEPLVDGLYNDLDFPAHMWPPPVTGEHHIRTIVAHHGKQLRHLAVCARPPARELWMPFDQRIVHFKDFVNLTHLEMNLNILRPSAAVLRRGQTIHHLPRSLTDILPASIQVVRVITAWIDYRVFDRLLLKIPSERDSTPSLRKIHFRLPYNYKTLFLRPSRSSRRLSDRWEDTLNLQPWREELEPVRIALIVEEVQLFYAKVEPLEQWDD